MRNNCTIAAISILQVLSAAGQGTFLYDQQSSDERRIGEQYLDINTAQPMGQSFTPSFNSVGFVRLYLSDPTFEGVSSIAVVNLRSGSVTGPILASTEPVLVPESTSGPLDFFFRQPASVTPGVTYYFQPVVNQTGGFFGANLDGNFFYAGGTAFYRGAASSGNDLWFREGIVIPEPSALLLVWIGGLGCFFARRQIRKTRRESRAHR